ncbi:hypothetical protein [Halegenticoccus soli]|uniref:hypothetical protein n=1 Tax=Halegenticoccus soli TaxID=1985678 RepID=UPI00117A4090|nr:hypothetical protein [Halegenticoccus soli]
MKKALRILMALVVVGTVFSAGLAGTVAADHSDWKDKMKDKAKDKTTIKQNQENYQNAEASVDQDQDVDQSNENTQVGASVGVFNKGDQSVSQSSEQVNYNNQEGYASASNYAEQNQEADA